MAGGLAGQQLRPPRSAGHFAEAHGALPQRVLRRLLGRAAREEVVPPLPGDFAIIHCAQRGGRGGGAGARKRAKGGRACLQNSKGRETWVGELRVG